jgi:ubiquinone/menaquinone biosynthesis C-methylase UbiE
VSIRPESPGGPQDEINGRLYRRADLVRDSSVLTLSPPEVMALIRYREDVVGRRVLDLGCGAGRLAAYLRPLAGRYVGLDVSPHMVNHCRQAFVGLEFLRGDMRHLQAFSDNSFDTVFAICNLFDAVSQDDRLKTLAEVRRVLAPGGLLVFSAHNRNYSGLGKGPTLQLSRNPFTQLRYLVEYLQSISNSRRIKPHQRFEADYVLLNDSGHNFAVLHYYISRE